jgi:hypothetical protein
VRPLALWLLLALFSACGAEHGPRAVIETKGDEVTVHVEVADTQAERARGLMGRREPLEDDLLPRGRGPSSEQNRRGRAYR